MFEILNEADPRFNLNQCLLINPEYCDYMTSDGKLKVEETERILHGIDWEASYQYFKANNGANHLINQNFQQN